ncbi:MULTISPECIES: alpha/beta hydrolase [unclassified Phenylobacterium]|uniref:alpha/beta hydrolase n=1 Tax=unclassified Phenylobacterium TaxID=2640670 RepID=UPI00083A5471|nr:MULTISPECIES: alpha/beta hydrolase [unclassified Phenylobacterium]
MDLDRRTLLALASTAAATPALAQAADPTETVRLWPGRPPGALAALPREVITDRTPTSGFQDRYVTGIGEPLLTVFRPARPNGAACVIAPGGGYIRVVIDKEGFEIARRLAEAGVTSFVLRYRLPAEGWANPSDTPLQDAQRAVRLVRAAAPRYGIDPARLAFLGCSAGGHLAASLATGHGRAVYAPVDEADRLSARPDLSALLYPVIDMSLPHAHCGSRTALLGPAPSPQAEAAYSPHRQVTAQTPPTFLVHAADDASVPVENGLNYLSALRAAKIPAEAHIFEEGGHGFGIYLARGKPAHAWPDLFLAWAARRGWLTAA